MIPLNFTSLLRFSSPPIRGTAEPSVGIPITIFQYPTPNPAQRDPTGLKPNSMLELKSICGVLKSVGPSPSFVSICVHSRFSSFSRSAGLRLCCASPLSVSSSVPWSHSPSPLKSELRTLYFGPKAAFALYCELAPGIPRSSPCATSAELSDWGSRLL